MILAITILIAAVALAALNFAGAISLTGNLAMATVLGCMATAQWAAARQALVLARWNPDKRSPLARWSTFGALLTFYLIAAAWITVPLSAAKLDQLLGVAKEVQQTRFDDETAAIRRRAKEVGVAYDDLASRLRQLQAHAAAMRDLEATKGGSCLTSRGDQPGEIWRFREQEARLAGELVNRAAAPVAAAGAIADTVGKITLDSSVAVHEAERTLASATDDLNRLSQAPVLGALREYVRQADESAREILIPRRGGLPPEKFNCVDAQRTATLAGLLKGVDGLAKLPALPKPLLMDASSGQDIAKAKLIGSWSTVFGVLPIHGASSLVDPILLKRYRMGEGYVLSGPRLSWGVAWALELLLLVLIALQVNERGKGSSRGQHLLAALIDIAVRGAAAKPGRIGSIASSWIRAQNEAEAKRTAEAAARPTAWVEMPPAPEFDPVMAGRWQLLYRYLITVSKTDYLLVPAADGRALAAAREAVLQRLAAPVVQGLTGEELAAHPQIRANPAFVGHAPHDPGMRWWLFRITDASLTQYLLQCWRNEPGAA